MGIGYDMAINGNKGLRLIIKQCHREFVSMKMHFGYHINIYGQIDTPDNECRYCIGNCHAITGLE
jgi:hypothetical protein